MLFYGCFEDLMVLLFNYWVDISFIVVMLQFYSICSGLKVNLQPENMLSSTINQFLRLDICGHHYFFLKSHGHHHFSFSLWFTHLITSFFWSFQSTQNPLHSKSPCLIFWWTKNPMHFKKLARFLGLLREQKNPFPSINVVSFPEEQEILFSPNLHQYRLILDKN